MHSLCISSRTVLPLDCPVLLFYARLAFALLLSAGGLKHFPPSALLRRASDSCKTARVRVHPTSGGRRACYTRDFLAQARRGE
ncbi:hypothetical protein DFH11DRAFT_1621052 [Phellopilus nigrolimitatus]|nr:hypothetical protein DFH11DRAFT_1621052 [Phellopilus nigrolimitatus]